MLELFTVFAAERDERTCDILGALKLKAEVLRFLQMKRVRKQRERRRQARYKFAYLKMKKQHALHVHFSFLYISQQCCSLARHDVKCFAVVGTT